MGGDVITFRVHYLLLNCSVSFQQKPCCVYILNNEAEVKEQVKKISHTVRQMGNWILSSRILALLVSKA